MSQPSFGAGVSLCGHPHPSLILPLLVASFLCLLPCYDIPRQNYSWNFPLWMLACHCGHPPMTSAPVVDHASYNLVASRVDLLPPHDVIPKQICSWHFPLWMPPPPSPRQLPRITSGLPADTNALTWTTGLPFTTCNAIMCSMTILGYYSMFLFLIYTHSGRFLLHKHFTSKAGVQA